MRSLTQQHKSSPRADQVSVNRTARKLGRRRCVLSALAIFLAAALSASATTFAKLSLEQLVNAAPLIVRARCQGNIVVTQQGEIRTITSFEVRETWKGSAPQVIRVRLLGGRTAQLTSHVEGVPRFRPGEEVVLFLEPRRDGSYSVTSWVQGTFRIHKAGPGAQLVVTEDTAAFARATLARSASAQEAASGPVQSMPLAEFRRRVQVAPASPPASDDRRNK